MADNPRRVSIGMSNYALTQSEHNSFEGSLDDISENGASLILSVPFESCLSPFQRGDFLNYW
jgi:hypothetical protein